MTRTPEQLAEGLKHVGYELMMATELVPLLASGPTPVDANAYLESMLVHLRSLVGFFIRPASKFPTDIRRTDFAPEWTPTPAAAVQRLEKAQPDLDKHLSHLTWERVDDDKPGWDFPSLVGDITTVAAAWVDHLELTAPELAKELRPFTFFAKKTIVTGPMVTTTTS